MRTIALLTISNIFMTFAWYGHLKYRNVPLFKAILLSWMIAFFEYCFQVPQPHWLLRIHRGPAEDRSGSHYARGFFRFLGFLFEAADSMEISATNRQIASAGNDALR